MIVTDDEITVNVSEEQTRILVSHAPVGPVGFVDFQRVSLRVRCVLTQVWSASIVRDVCFDTRSGERSILVFYEV